MRSPPAVAPCLFPLVGAVLVYRSGLVRWRLEALFSPFPGSIPGWHVFGAVRACVPCALRVCRVPEWVASWYMIVSCLVRCAYISGFDSLYMFVASCFLGVSQLINPY